MAKDEYIEYPGEKEYDEIVNREDPYLQKHNTGKLQDNSNLTSDKIADTDNVHISNMFDDLIYKDLTEKG